MKILFIKMKTKKIFQFMEIRIPQMKKYPKKRQMKKQKERIQIQLIL